MPTPSLPISLTSAGKARRWMIDHFGPRLAAATAGTPFDPNHLCAIVCQESAIYWLQFPAGTSVQDTLGRCVFDASGDYPGTSRHAFPHNLAHFLTRYPQAAADLLIAEANKMRALRHLAPANYLYKGYGLFQYDLQYIQTDEAFFLEKKWYEFDECLTRAMGELTRKYAATGDVWQAIRAYNGSGPAAELYRLNVEAFYDFFAKDPHA